MKRPKGLLILFCFLLLSKLPLLSVPVEAPPVPDKGSKEKAETSDFIRFVEDGSGGGTLETAVVTYEREDGVKVHLVGAVHVGEKYYYAALEHLFTKYDSLLYEMIKDKGASLENLSRRRSGGGAVNLLQRWMKDTLHLAFQLEAIDYTRDNFIHADMDATSFFNLQKKRGESLLGLMLQSIKTELARQEKGEKVAQITLFDLIRIFLSNDHAREMKLVLGRQFSDIEASIAGIEGKNGSVILTERNKVAIQVLEETIKKGKRNLGIFYGAAHMQDMEKRLIDKLGFKKIGQEWYIAWNMLSAVSVEKVEKKVEKVEKNGRTKVKKNQAWF